MDVRAMTRHPERYDGPGTPVGADVGDEESLAAALAGVDVAIYLVHSLDHADFEARDADAARRFGRLAAEAGLRQIVYLGGLGRDDEEPLPAPALAARGRGTARRGRRAGHRAARRDRGRPRGHLLGA
ncbi:NAD(P)H-binding protein [Nocardioides convexus]|uniref:NAD(P)H-binding protein n=1 Tax=Nocardioides convexus TaxID=2712224 RepID=UPI0024184962|nr:NAD(P)H-binding protein [Nocardioides convexus]